MGCSQRTKSIFRLSITAIVIFLLLTLIVNYIIFRETRFVIYLLVLYFIWVIIFLLLKRVINRELNFFTSEIIKKIDSMLGDNDFMMELDQQDTVMAAIHNKLFRLYESMKFQNEEIGNNRNFLQAIISDVSHQLKTPTTNLQLAIEQAKDTNSNLEVLKYLSLIELQIENISMLTTCLINSSRLEIGIVQLEPEKNNFYETLVEVVQSLIVNNKRMKQKIHIDCSKDLLLKFDSKWTKEALVNILDNALKYSGDDGKISIKVIQESLYTKINICDTGIGIAEENFGLIFKRFGRVQGNSKPGLGIGLYLAKKIINLQGGYINVKSEIGKGTCFAISLRNK